ncbi:hypothetical protein PROFUN_00717 [Planoprotostelium fungivorum]|uniref:Uncharacterized protein n=1 Tax=Planoprotostelium fungivorum TaxID=1890364 RepID=A0A2P6NU93_9EUKA|nr:hypothetical protein PROFUN_00717 [Planoprotostelium fungivorum]
MSKDTPNIPASSATLALSSKIQIKAPAARVWEILSHFEDYSWSTFTPVVSLPQTLEPGTQGHLDSYVPLTANKPTRVQLTIDEFNAEQRRIVWQGGIGTPHWLLYAQRVQQVTEIDGENCEYEHWESQTGVLARVVKWTQTNNLIECFDRHSQDLKKKAESVDASQQ